MFDVRRSTSEKIGRNVVTSLDSRDMRDVEIRLKHMDELGIDVEVLHNTIFIVQVADRPQVEVPICRGWNRWVANIWKRGKGRLRWTCIPPLLSMPDAVDEIRFGKEHGAVGVLMRPIEGSRVLVDPYFYPVYQEAQRLDVPIVIHIANANPWYDDLYTTPFETGNAFGKFMAPAAIVCHQVMMSQLLQLFPTLRWAIVEAGAQWLPWVIGEAKRRYQVDGRQWPEEGFQAFRMYVTCQTNNDMPYIIKYAGEDNLLIGTDYGHTDISSQVDAITILKQTAELTPRQFEKIADVNPRAVFGL